MHAKWIVACGLIGLGVAGCLAPESREHRAVRQATTVSEERDTETDRPLETTGVIPADVERQREAASALARAQAELDTLAPNWSRMTPAQREAALIDLRCRHTGCPPEAPGGAR